MGACAAATATRLIALTVGLLTLVSCGRSTQQYELFWVGDRHALFLADGTVHAGDRAQIHRQTWVKHPTSQKDLGVLDEVMGETQVLSVQGGLGILETAALLELHVGDRVTLVDTGTLSTTAHRHPVGTIAYLDTETERVVVDWSSEQPPDLSQQIIIGMPMEVIDHPGETRPIALRMRSIARIDEPKLSQSGEQLTGKLTEITRGRPVVMGDPVYQSAADAPQAWFVLPDAAWVEYFRYRRPYELGLHWYALSQFARVVDALETVHERSPGFRDTLFLLGMSYQYLGDYTKALETIRASAESKSAGVKSWLALAYLYQLRGESESSIYAYEAIVELVPDQPSYWLELGDLYHQMDRPDESAQAYRRVLEIQPDHDEAQQRLTLFD